MPANKVAENVEDVSEKELKEVNILLEGGRRRS